MFDNVAQTFTKLLDMNQLDYIIGKGHAKHSLGFSQRNAALTQIEESVVVQLPRSHTMRTLHIIGIDLQLRLGVHASRIIQKEVAIVLISFCAPFAT